MRQPSRSVFPAATPDQPPGPPSRVRPDPAGRVADSGARHGTTAVFGSPLLVAIGSRTAVPAGSDLPCLHTPELFFSESPQDVEPAKKTCRGCQARTACLAGALERREACGVCGGELLMQGAIVPVKRPRGRPRKTGLASGLKVSFTC